MSTQSVTEARQATTIHGLILILAAVMPAMAIISLVPVMPLLGREFGPVPGAKALIPIALTIPALCVALFSPLAGWLSDRAGRKKLLVFALLGYAAIGIVPFFLTDLKQIIGARIGLGIFEAVIMTVATALIGDYFKGAERQKWIGIQVGFVSVSAIFLIAIGGVLGEMIGSRGPFLMYLAAVPIALLAGAILFEPAVIEKTSGPKLALPWAKLLPLLLITLGVGIFFYTAIVKLGDILGLSGEVSPGVIGGVGAAFNVGVMLGTIIFLKLKKFSSGPKLLAIGMALFAVGYGGMGLSGTFSMTVAFAIISSLGAGLLLPTMLTWVMNILPPNVRGRGTGLWTGMFFLGQFVAPLVAVAMYKPAGGLGNVLLVYGAVALVLMIIAAISARGAKVLKQEH
ncbi:MFS transporter [Litorimonas cladophorae]|uniref:MFS transporter n=1 Tax=Litorimonas cladophorae TaxID=1220491 RepID=A0A918NF13_9PROT|nr:MFS transporter [Litorimonas cladophorae]GGX63043.1 MFS transporter [Litorimonas cladophorae]